MLAEADREFDRPVVSLALWEGTAVIPQELQGAALWTRCVGFKGSEKKAASLSGKNEMPGLPKRTHSYIGVIFEYKCTQSDCKEEERESH